MTTNDSSDTKMETISSPLLLTYKQTAQILGLGCRSIMYLADENKVERVYPRKGAPRITRASVLKFVESMSQKHTPTPCNKKDRENKQSSKDLNVRSSEKKPLRQSESKKTSTNTQKLLNYLK